MLHLVNWLEQNSYQLTKHVFVHFTSQTKTINDSLIKDSIKTTIIFSKFTVSECFNAPVCHLHEL